MRALLVVASPALFLVAVLIGLLVVIAPGGVGIPPAQAVTGCSSTPSDAVAQAHLDASQWQVARDVVQVGQRLHVPPRGWVIALATGMQESGLRALGSGDRDSLGVFQQRAGWGSVSDRMNPMTAAQMFYTGGHGGQPGLTDIPGWQEMPLTQAAQTVQQSGYPDAYAKWEPLGVELVARLTGADASCHPVGSWANPLGSTRYVLTAGFGECGPRWSHCHTGQDFAVPIGTPVASAGDGVVTFAGWAGPYGNAIHILHAGGIATWYAHLSRLDAVTGTQVRAGEVIGLSGASGNTTGPHLHFEVRLGASATTAGTPIDPLPWLQQRGLI